MPKTISEAADTFREICLLVVLRTIVICPISLAIFPLRVSVCRRACLSGLHLAHHQRFATVSTTSFPGSRFPTRGVLRAQYSLRVVLKHQDDYLHEHRARSLLQRCLAHSSSTSLTLHDIAPSYPRRVPWTSVNITRNQEALFKGEIGVIRLMSSPPPLSLQGNPGFSAH